VILAREKGDMSPIFESERSIYWLPARFFRCKRLCSAKSFNLITALSGLRPRSRSFAPGHRREFNPTSSTPPIGAHVTLRTSSGIVDVHLAIRKCSPPIIFRWRLVTPCTSPVRLSTRHRDSIRCAHHSEGHPRLVVRSLQGIPLKPARGRQRHASQRAAGRCPVKRAILSPLWRRLVHGGLRGARCYAAPPMATSPQAA